MSNIVIVGSGPAGVSAALYAVRAGVQTTVLTKGSGALARAETIENYYGFAQPVSGQELERRSIENARRLGVQFVQTEAVGLTWTDRLTVETLAGAYPADAVILATGASRAVPRIPGLTGLELAQRVQRHGLAVKVVIVTTFARGGFLRRALDAGVQGYLLKDAPAEKLADALRQVHRGGRAIDPQLALEAWSEGDPLSDRERQVLRLAGEGLGAGEIAAQLNLSNGTVRNYLSEAIGKLGVGNRIEAYRLARQKGWL